MRSRVSIGVARSREQLTLAKREVGSPTEVAHFPANPIGAHAIGIYLHEQEASAGLTVADDLMDLALSWGRNALVRTIIVASRTHLDAQQLARYGGAQP